MEEELLKIAKKYLDKGLNKNFYIHTLGVLRAAKDILRFEKGDVDIVIPAAIFHDTGWALVPIEYQGNSDPEKTRIGMKMHLEKGAEVAGEEMRKLEYDNNLITNIQDIIKLHKFASPEDINARILIDADNLSDIYSDQFKSDLTSYKKTPKEMLKHRSKNTFYSEYAREVFEVEFKKRKAEYNLSD